MPNRAIGHNPSKALSEPAAAGMIERVTAPSAQMLLLGAAGGPKPTFTSDR